MAEEEDQQVEQHSYTSNQHEPSGPSHDNEVDAPAGSDWQFSGLVDPHSIFDPTSVTGTTYPFGMDAAFSFGNFNDYAALHSGYYSDSNLNDLMLTQPGLVDPLANAYDLAVPESGGDLWSFWYNPWSCPTADGNEALSQPFPPSTADFPNLTAGLSIFSPINTAVIGPAPILGLNQVASTTQTEAIAPLPPPAPVPLGPKRARPTNDSHGGNTSKKRRKFDEPGRQKVKGVRTMGSCLRCKIYHESCDENDTCSRCEAVAPLAYVYIQPCYREKLDNIMVFRAGNSRANQKRSQLPRLRWTASDQAIRVVQVQYPFVSTTGVTSTPLPKLTMSCRKFTPGTTDTLRDVWSGDGGAELVLDFPPFACNDTNSAAEGLEKYIEDCESLLSRDLAAETLDPLSCVTLREASRFASLNPDSSVGYALRIRRIAYFSRESMVIVGNETLGISRVEDKRFPIYNQIPVPSILDFQIDTLAINLMHVSLKRIIGRLKKVFFGKRSEQCWYEAYLTIFVLLDTLMTVFKLQLSYQEWNANMDENTLADVSYITTSMTKEWEYSAKNLLAHFRCVLRGMVPFSPSLDWYGPRDSLNKNVLLGMDDIAIEYMQTVTKILPDWLKRKRAEQNDLAHTQAQMVGTWLISLYECDVEGL